MIICNIYCDYCHQKGYEECWREICPDCGGYIFLHGDDRNQIENLTPEHHRCRPEGIRPRPRRRRSTWPQDVASVG